MAIVQISQIQIRRGLQQDLPQLASGEMGWSTDTRQLYIGNGIIGAPDYAPTEGVTEILTEYSNFLSSINNYTFAGSDSGYTSRTSTNPLTPTTRTLQSVLDDMISVRDFGAIGDGIADNTADINRAIQQIYAASVNATYAGVRRTIKFPAGTYVISGPIYIPPNCTLIGDGKNNTIIACTSGTAFITSDSNFLTGGSMSGSYPNNIFIAGMKISTGSGTSPAVQIDSTTNLVFEQCYFQAPAGASGIVSLASRVSNTKATTFNGCVFDGGINGITTTGTNPIIGVRVTNSFFINNTGCGINISSVLSGVVSENNYFDSTVPTPIIGLTGNNYSYGDVVAGSNTDGGLYSGAAKFGAGQTVQLSIGSNNIRTLGNNSGKIDYTITDSSGNFRYGSLVYTNSGGVTTFSDDYVEPTVSLGANLYADTDGILTCTAIDTATLRYDIKNFI